jgi:hypothetical protein
MKQQHLCDCSGSTIHPKILGLKSLTRHKTIVAWIVMHAAIPILVLMVINRQRFIQTLAQYQGYGTDKLSLKNRYQIITHGTVKGQHL